MQPKVLQLTPEQAQKIARAKLRRVKTILDPEWFFVAEFGHYFGWDGVQSILDDEIDLETANLLLTGARKVRYQHLVDDAVATQVAIASANSKKPKQTFNKGMSEFVKAGKI